MRRTSVFTLWFDVAEVMPGSVDRQIDLIASVIAGKGVEVAGSGADPRPYVMFRTANDDTAVSLARLFPSLTRPTLTTGQGTHTRTINLEGTTMSTKTTYDVILSDGTGAGNRARKDAAIKLGNMQDDHFTVVANPSGTVVYNSKDGEDADIETPTEDAPVETKAAAPAKASTPKKEKTVTKKQAEPATEAEETAEQPTMEIEFEGLGKYYARAAGLYGAEVVGQVYGVEATLKGNTISLYGSEEDCEQVAEHLRSLWPAAKLAQKEYRKTDKVYSAISKDRKDKEANAQRWDLEVKWFQTFMDGAAAELAGTAKKKGGAYKDGILAIQNPTAPADDADVI